MTLRRAQIVEFLRTVIVNIPDVFPCDIRVDRAGNEGWRDLDCDLRDSANLLSGKFEVTINSGPENQWEGVRKCTLAYAVTGPDEDARAARRDLAVPAIEAALAADRTIGSGDPQVWAELGDTTEDDDSPLFDAPNVSVALIDIDITYVAASAAG
jgi:hypothetical protein